MAYRNIVDYQEWVDDKFGWTGAFKKAIEELAAGGGGTLLVPAGTYRTCSICLESYITLQLEAGSRLEFIGEPELYEKILIGHNGRPRPMYMPLIYAVNAEYVAIAGDGIIHGHGENWWGLRAKLREQGKWRPHTICFDHCRHVRVENISILHSPSWTIHPFECSDVLVRGVRICNPWDSPNTDGINPNSSRNVRIESCVIDVGDDCIAIKAGTEESQAPSACENIIISDCQMLHGHGGIVIGSETAGSVKNVVVTNCIFQNTDRGIRLKSRRQRGGVIEQIRIQNIIMDRVMCPFVFNMYYFCGDKGKAKYVWDKEAYPVNTATPIMRKISISHVSVYRAEAAAGFLYGLSEMPVQDVSFSNCTIEMDPDGEAGRPALMDGLMDGIEDMKCRGIFMRNGLGIQMNQVKVFHCQGPQIDADESVKFSE